MDVHHAVGEVVPVVANCVHAQTFRGRMRFRGRVVGAELWMLPDDTGLARNILITLDLSLATRIAGLR
jgi:hypothetical protein